MVTKLAESGPRKIFEPDDVEQLLRGWLFHAHKGRRRHDLAARKLSGRKTLLGGTAAVVSAIVGTSIVAGLEKETTNLAFTAGIALLGITSAILTSLNAFLNLAERAEKHRAAGVGYKKGIRELERVLSRPVDTLPKDDPSLLAIQKRLDDLEDNAPVVPEKIYDRVEDEWNKRGVHLVEKAADLYKD